MNATIKEFFPACLDEAKLILFVPMAWIGLGARNATSELDAREVQPQVSYRFPDFRYSSCVCFSRSAQLVRRFFLTALSDWRSFRVIRG